MFDSDALGEHPHHDGSPLYTDPARPVLGGTVRVWVRVPATAGVTDVRVRTTPDGDVRYTPAAIDHDRSGRVFGGYGAKDVWWYADVPVRNPVTNYRFLLLGGPGESGWLTAAGAVGHEVRDTTDFRLVTHDPGPDWAAEAVVYEIFPDRYARSADAPDPADLPDWAVPAEWDRDEVVYEGPDTPLQFFGGTLDGIAEHLDHLQSLNVTAIYLRPVFPAASNHRYNATTFDSVDPLLGGDAALTRLADAVHARGLRLIGDITTNHCGDTHEWFRAAQADPAAPEREMFYFDADGGYEAWYGIPSLPKFNWGSDLVRERMTAVVRRWLDVYDGWRVDCANMTGRNRDEDRAHEIAAGLRAEIDAVRPDALVVAEHNYDAANDLDRGGWQGTMNYAGFTRPLWGWLRGDGTTIRYFIDAPGGVPRRDGRGALASIRQVAAGVSWSTYNRSWQLLDSYDVGRFRSVTMSRENHLVGAGLQATLPGTPMICGGDEFGLTGQNGEHARTPMPWNRPGDVDEPTLAAYRELFGLRAAEPALRRGGLRWLHADADVLVFLRETPTESLLVLAARAGHAPVRLPLDADLTGVYQAADETARNGAVTLPAGPTGVRVWRITG
ncbi:glycoside hydrolase family 13 protein [Hamadaea tsunoensis]|uniref:glycoside hydrolase family 13 protein n=1 Tax=Hamadaea tsunoensis TaxID=53368 RepID=UPI0004002FD5|nr:glycoside hydrolase family 13 protein [Hamadaea tsunoensis]